MPRALPFLLITNALVVLLPSAACAGFGDTLFVAVADESVSTFGWFVNSAGDLDGDGYNDIGVGDPDSNAGGAEAGRSYVYFTGPPVDDVADIVVTGTQSGQWCGHPQRAGDMNGDGRDDLAIGASGWGGERGRVFLFWGGPGFFGDVSASEANVKVTGTTFSDWFGHDIEPLGDVNRDGCDDLFVAAAFAGRAYVFFGDSTVSGVIPAVDADIVFDFPLGFVAALSSGDLDGDSQTDLVLGVFDGNGAVHVFFGDSTWADTTLTAADANVVILDDVGATNFGASLVCDGDFDADGFDDLAVGAATWDTPDEHGAVLVFYGRPDFPDTMLASDADWIIQGDGGDFLLAQMWTSPFFGDQDGDGDDDLVVLGHSWQHETGGQFGRAYLFVGDPIRRVGLTYSSEAEHKWTGTPTVLGLGKGGAWIPNATPGSTGAFVFGATANWNPEVAGKALVFDAGEGWSAVDAPIVASYSGRGVLLPCQPNPFGTATSIRYELPAGTAVSLAVYDVAGRLVRTLRSGPQEKGSHVVSWDRTGSDGKRLPDGVYFVRLEGKNFEACRKVVALN